MNWKLFFLLWLLLFSSPVFTQWTMAELSLARWDLAAVAANNKVLFAGGSVLIGGIVVPSDQVDIYDLNSAQWSQTKLSAARSNIAAFSLANKIFFCGGLRQNNTSSNVIDVYDPATDSWTTTQLSLNRSNFKGIVHNGKLLIAGGLSATAGYTDRVDIYDGNTNSWKTATLSKARIVGAVAAVDNKILFVGGQDNLLVYNTVDIYNTETDAWTTASLFEARTNISAAVIGESVFFAGGDFANESNNATNTVDIYDASTGQWSVSQLSEFRAGITSVVADDKILFAGGYTWQLGSITFRPTVDIFDTTTNTWSKINLSQPRRLLGAYKLGTRIFFVGDAFLFGKTVETDVVEIYDTETDALSTDFLAAQRYWARGVVAGNKLFVAGGLSAEGVPSKLVDIYTDNTVAAQNIDLQNNIKIFPNPTNHLLHIDATDLSLPALLEIYDITGKKLRALLLEQPAISISTDELSAGIYLLEIRNWKGRFSQFFVKKN